MAGIHIGPWHFAYPCSSASALHPSSLRIQVYLLPKYIHPDREVWILSPGIPLLKLSFLSGVYLLIEKSPHNTRVDYG